MTLTYPQGGELVDRFARARSRHDGDALTACFAEDAEVRLDPFAPPLLGHNALRAFLLDAAEAEDEYELTIERHWVSGDMLLAAWHASWRPAGTLARGRFAGFLAAEVLGGVIVRYRQWWNEREPISG